MLLEREDREAIRVMGFLYWAWCRTGAYRGFNRWIHRYNWHHCTILQPYGGHGRQHWCQWCGLRYVEPLPTPVIWTDEDVAFIQRFGAKHGVYIPDPDPDAALNARPQKAA